MMGLLLVVTGSAGGLAVLVLIRCFRRLINTAAAEQALEKG
jgi:hypothetical protein